MRQISNEAVKKLTKFQNEQSYNYDPAMPQFAQFPVIEDFEIVLAGSPAVSFQGEERYLGMHVHLASKSQGILVSLYDEHHRAEAWLAAASDAGDIALNPAPGSRYQELEQGWTLHIAADSSNVYVMQGTDKGNTYSTYFTVSRAAYNHEWNEAIRYAKSLPDTAAPKEQ